MAATNKRLLGRTVDGKRVDAATWDHMYFCVPRFRIRRMVNQSQLALAAGATGDLLRPTSAWSVVLPAEAGVSGHYDCAGSVGDVQFGEDVRYVVADGLVA